MKTIIKTTIILISVFALSENAKAQSKASDLSQTIEVNASADEVWQHIRKLDNIDVVSSFVATVDWKGPKGVGGERKCTAPDGKGYYVEQIQMFNDNQRTYQWEVVEGIPAKNVYNSFKVVDLGYQKSMIIFRSNYEYVENPNMTPEQLKAFISQATSEIVGNYAKLATKMMK